MEQSRENLRNMDHMDNIDNSNNINDSKRLNTSTRGFASMDPERQRQIAREGGKAAHLKGTAHEFTPDEARNAGRKGGETVSRDREHMAEIGRKGGRSSGNNRRSDDETRYTF
jgi:general stress protein YciG